MDMTDRNARFDQAVNRLLRAMAITNISVSTQPPAALFALNLMALDSAVSDLADLINDGAVPTDYTVHADDLLIGPATASAIADAITTSCPDDLRGLA